MAPRQKKTRSNMQTAFIRFMLVVAFFIFWIGAVSVRLVHLQVNEHSKWKAVAAKQRSDNIVTKSLRGSIYDRNGNALAISIKVKSLTADPTQVENVDELSDALAKILGRKSSEFKQLINKGKKDKKLFVWLARELEDEKVLEIKEKILTRKSQDDPDLSLGMYWKDEQRRDYPHKTLASHVIGFSNSDDIGKAGIEKSQEKVLKAETLKFVRKRNRQGRVFSETEIERTPARNITLTISKEIQYIGENALGEGIKATNAKSGKAIVLDPKTGEILGMANYPTFDPTNFRDLNPKIFRNSAVEDQYAPGSVFKLITYGAALEEELIEIDSEIDCGNGHITVGGHTFNDSHAVGNVNYITAMAHSSNVGAIKTGLRIGKDDFFRYAQKFGFGTPTGIRLPSEATGVVRNPKNWSGTDLASISIGYGVDVTALQTAVAFATIANDGVRVEPRIVKSIDQEGKTLETFQSKSVRIVKSETARDLKVMLREVINDGTAKQAKLNGYTSAGKTGTAWKYDAKTGAPNKNKYVASFVGFAPADNPEVVIAVVIDEPRGSARNGGQVAGPIFRDIAQRVLSKLKVAPDAVFVENIKDEENPEPPKTTKPAKQTTAAKPKKPKPPNKNSKKDSKKAKKATGSKSAKELKAALILPGGKRSEVSPHLRI